MWHTSYEQVMNFGIPWLSAVIASVCVNSDESLNEQTHVFYFQHFCCTLILIYNHGFCTKFTAQNVYKKYTTN